MNERTAVVGLAQQTTRVDPSKFRAEIATAPQRESPLRSALEVQESSITELHRVIEVLYDQLEGLCIAPPDAKQPEEKAEPPRLHSSILAKVAANTSQIEEARNKLDSLLPRLEI